MNRQLITALCTPYKDGQIDKLSLERLVKFQVDNGADKLLCAGTTGENNFINECETKLIFRIAKGVASNLPIMGYVGKSNTADAVRQAKFWQDLGASELLVAPPSFSKCTPQGYVCHVKEIANAVQLPLTLYNVPQRCGYPLDLSSLRELSRFVVGIKDAGTDENYTQELTYISPLFCGNDLLLSQHVAMGAQGVISVVANFAPRLAQKVLGGATSPLWTLFSKFCSSEISPIVAKYLLYKKGIFDTFEMRLPLTEPSAQLRYILDSVCEYLGDDL